MKLPFRNKFFTLIELMVVIAIIVILAGLLLPALKKAKDIAYESVCRNNEKQIGSAFLLYINDYQEYFPIVMYSSGENWISMLVKKAGYLNGKVFICPQKNSTYPDMKKYWENANTYSYNAAFWSYPDYGYNTIYLGRTCPPDLSSYKDIPAKITQVRKPSETITAVDNANYGATGRSSGSYYVCPYYSSNSVPVAWPTHNGKANVIWVDGHVKSIKGGAFASETGSQNLYNSSALGSFVAAQGGGVNRWDRE